MASSYLFKPNNARPFYVKLIHYKGLLYEFHIKIRYYHIDQILIRHRFLVLL